MDKWDDRNSKPNPLQIKCNVQPIELSSRDTPNHCVSYKCYNDSFF
jgi:hypothetical protein